MPVNVAASTVADSGAPGSYLTIEALPGEHVILDGSDVGVNDPATDNWFHYQGNIYYVDLSWGADCSMPNYVGEQRAGDGMRYLLYRGASAWDDFLTAPPGKAYHDCDGPHRGRLYVVTYNADDPDNHEMYVSRQITALELEGADHVRIRNIEFRYYGHHGVFLDSPGADHNIIEGNTFHGIGRYHIRVGRSLVFC